MAAEEYVPEGNCPSCMEVGKRSPFDLISTIHKMSAPFQLRVQPFVIDIGDAGCRWRLGSTT